MRNILAAEQISKIDIEVLIMLRIVLKIYMKRWSLFIYYVQRDKWWLRRSNHQHIRSTDTHGAATRRRRQQQQQRLPRPESSARRNAPYASSTSVCSSSSKQQCTRAVAYFSEFRPIEQLHNSRNKCIVFIQNFKRP